MEYLYCQNTECGEYLGSLGGSECNLCGWRAGRSASDEEPEDHVADELSAAHSQNSEAISRGWKD